MSSACCRLAWGGDGASEEPLAIRPPQSPPSGFGNDRTVRGSFLAGGARRAGSLVSRMRSGVRVPPQQLRATVTGFAVAGASRPRSAESFEAWLKQQPRIRVISRDRGGIYAEGARLGSPAARQVADRFHLFLNLSAAVERSLEERSRQTQLAVPAAPQAEAADSLEVQKTRQQALQQERRQRRLERYEEVIQLHRQGCSQKKISQSLHLEGKTVRRWIRAGQFPERKSPRGCLDESPALRGISPAALGRRMSQRHTTLRRNPLAGLSRRPQHGGATRGGMEKFDPSRSTPAENHAETGGDLDYQTSQPVDRRTTKTSRSALGPMPGLAEAAETVRGVSRSVP